MKRNQLGFGIVETLFVFVIISLLGLGGWYVYTSRESDKKPESSKSASGSESEKPCPIPKKLVEPIQFSCDGSDWKVAVDSAESPATGFFLDSTSSPKVSLDLSAASTNAQYGGPETTCVVFDSEEITVPNYGKLFLVRQASKGENNWYYEVGLSDKPAASELNKEVTCVPAPLNFEGKKSDAGGKNIVEVGAYTEVSIRDDKIFEASSMKKAEEVLKSIRYTE